MSGFNWLQWISKLVSTADCPRSRRGRAKRSNGATEALEERMLLSASPIMPQIGVNDSTTGDDSRPAPDDDSPSQTSVPDDILDYCPGDTAPNNGSTFLFGPQYSRSFSVSPDEAQTIDPSPDDDSIAPDPTDDGDPGSIQDLIRIDNAAAPQAQRQFTFSVPEMSPAVTLVGFVTTTDTDPNANVSYAITSGNDDGAFSINPTTGQIAVADGALLDFESQPSIQLTVEVTDNTTSSFSETVDVTVNLTNVNEAPTMGDTTLSVPENSPDATFVGNVFASDPDVGSAFQFALTSGNTAGAFTINAYTGKVTVANGALLDFETRPIYHLTVQVTDNGSPPLSGTAQLTIQLTNVNDPPIISVVPANTKYTLGASATRFATQATVSDEDNPIPDFTGVVLSVSITENRSNKDVLAVKDTGEKSKKIVIHGNNVVYGKTVIGTVEGGKGSEPTLNITLNSVAKTAGVEALLHALSFSTKDTSTDPRTLKMQFTSPDGHVLSTTSKSIAIKKPHTVSKLPGWGFY
ncbi:MAG: exported protein of unknown function [Planctomycetaceae bacterium]|nr:exported protein of unknown function [Planctomycetaceae bacterium]